jgi:PAS domain S-box-containing protein
MAELDLAGTLTLVERQFCAITGYAERDLLGRRLDDITHPDDVHAFRAIFAHALATGGAFSHECRWVRPDRSQHWVSLTGALRGSHDGQPPQIVVVATDISERKRSELNAAFLDLIGKDLATLSAPDEIMQTVGARVGKAMQLSGCVFSDVDEERGENTVHYAWNIQGVPSLKQTFRIDDYVGEEFGRAGRAGEAFIVRDTQHDGRVDAVNYARLNVGSFVIIPFHWQDEWTWFFAASTVEPRDWRADEIELLREISNRVFSRIQRARAEQALHESEGRFGALSEAMPGLAWRNDAEGRNLFVNRHYLEFTGKTAQQIRDTGWYDVLHPDDADAYIASYLDAVRARQPWHDRVRLRRHDGVWCWHQSQIQPLLAEDGSYLGDVGIAIDVTERIEAEQALRESEGLLRALIANLPGGAAFVVDHDLRYVLADGEALYDAGMTPDDLVGKTIWKALDPDLATRYARLYKQALQGKPYVHEHAAHGHTYLTHGTPLRAANGEVYAVLAVSYDISERKRSEAALRASEARFRTVTDAVPQVSWTNAADGTANYFNQRWFTYSGLSLEASFGLGWQAIVHPDDAPASTQRWNRALAAGTIFDTEYRLRRADGVYRWHLGRNVPLHDAEGRVTGWFGSATDIHDERLALEAAQTAKAEAEAALRVRDQFLSIASHELRTPLTSLLGYANMLLMPSMQNADNVRRMAERISRQTQRLDALIGQLLDVSRIQQGQFTLMSEPVDLAALVAEIVDETRATLPPPNIHVITYHGPNEPVLIAGDRQRLEQVVQNLLSNAVKYSPAGGTIHVEVRHTPTEAVVEVADQGIGIPQEAQARLWEPFFRAPNVAPQTSGFGLGLHIVREIVQRHGGRGEVTSAEGAGSTFRVVFPL